MDDNIEVLIEELNSKNNIIRKNALDTLLEITEEKVDWIYSEWDHLVDKFNSYNSFQRNIGVLIMSNLAKSDHKNKFAEIIDMYLELMEDEKFITSRQTIQNSWKVAVALDSYRRKIVSYLIRMFSNNKHLNTHANLIRKDIVESLIHIYNYYKDDVDLNLIEIRIKADCEDKERKILESILKLGVCN
ncbi:MAG: hypothetical protein CVV02_12400 [Firmicutes bacterium HGW-Firmicutes-7]|nr:MAG: hypothetical protein CVV02_12400 [Firmicutes bacterium HGW-Firmicutes-7]